MPVFLAFVGVGWIVAGAFVLRNALELVAGVASVLHQQYIMGELILGVMLASFGMVMIGLAGVIDALRKRDTSPAVTTCKRTTAPAPASPHSDLLARVPPYARARMARELGA